MMWRRDIRPSMSECIQGMAWTGRELMGERDSSMKREHESRLRQLDRLDKDVKSASDSVKAWKSRSQIKQAEVDSCKVSMPDWSLLEHAQPQCTNRPPSRI